MEAAKNPNDRQTHWENVYRSKDDSQLSWRQDDPATSLRLIQTCADGASHVLDVGGGNAILARRLVERGFEHITVMDIAASAIERAKVRAGPAKDRIRWLVGDVTSMPDVGPVDLWHDRAVFHFLTDPADRAAYGRSLRQTLKPGGFAIIATFALAGPDRCSDLPVMRYDAASLTREIGDDFTLVTASEETHVTPWGKPQAFTYAVLRRDDTISRTHDDNPRQLRGR